VTRFGYFWASPKAGSAALRFDFDRRLIRKYPPNTAAG